MALDQSCVRRYPFQVRKRLIIGLCLILVLATKLVYDRLEKGKQ